MTGCRCDGRYAACDHPQPCPGQPGGWRSPLFCSPCDQARIASIKADMDQIAAQFGRRQEAHRNAAAEGLDGWARFCRGEQIHLEREAKP